MIDTQGDYIAVLQNFQGIVHMQNIEYDQNCADVDIAKSFNMYAWKTALVFVNKNTQLANISVYLK